MKKIYQLIPVLVFLFTSLHSRASHVVGADISYTCASTPGVYKVTLKIYRDCVSFNFCKGCENVIPNGTTAGCTTSSASIQTPITGAEGSCNGLNLGSYTLTAASGANGYDIIQTCNKRRTICTNCNTRTAGTETPAIDVYIFEGNVDLSNLPFACCKVALGVDVSSRNLAITLFVPQGFYTECIVDRCISPCNSSPTFSNDPVAVICAGVDFVYNLGAIDPDGDSLSYSFGESLQKRGVSVQWNPPFSAAYPLKFLGEPNQNAPYPAGLRINPISGDVFFRPSGVFVSNLVVEVKQWKLIGTVWVNVGTTRRDVQIQSQFCATNLAPKIKIYQNGMLQIGQSFSVDEGEPICLDIVAEDSFQKQPYVISDTTDIFWNNPRRYSPVMLNATWVANYIVSQRGKNGPKADSFKFCWTPPFETARTQPYSFTIKGVDRYCPLPASVTRGINIIVNKKALNVKDINLLDALKLYPNPSKTFITISNKSKYLAGREYRISNLVGQTLISGKLNTEETPVNIESLSSGVYLLSIEGLNSQSIKVVKE